MQQHDLTLERLGTGDDLNELSGDRSLTGLVVLELEVLEDVLGVTGGVVHGSHLGCDLGGGVLHHRSVDDHSGVELGEGLEHLSALVLGLELEEGVLVAALGDELEGGDVHDGRLLGHGGEELVEENLGALSLSGQHLLGDAGSDGEVGGDGGEDLGHHCCHVLWVGTTELPPIFSWFSPNCAREIIKIILYTKNVDIGFMHVNT